MNIPEIINELEMIIAHHEEAKDRATRLKVKLARIHGGAPRKEPKGVSAEQIVKVIAKRRKYIMSKQDQ